MSNKNFTYIIISGMLLLVHSIPSFGQQKAPLQITIRQIPSDSIKYLFSNCDTTQTYTIQTILSNTTSDTLSFYLMNCSRSYSFITNSDSTQLCLELCARNFPQWISLSPEGSKIIYLQIHSKAAVGDFSCKLGLAFANDKHKDFFRQTVEAIQRKELIWSNPLQVLHQPTH